MKIFNEGIPFECACGIKAEANVPADFTCVRCNGDDIYSIVCPNCGKQYEIPEEYVPSYLKQHIKKTFVGLGKFVD